MSGSPAYIDGKLAALSLFVSVSSPRSRSPHHADQRMLEIKPDGPFLRRERKLRAQGGSRCSYDDRRPGQLVGRPAQGFANALKPIETPLVFSGFNEDAVRLFASQFSAPAFFGNGRRFGQRQQAAGTVVNGQLARCWFAANMDMRLPAP